MVVSKKLTVDGLDAYFTHDSFVIESSDVLSNEVMNEWAMKFHENKFDALYQLSFYGKQPWFSPSIDFLYDIGGFLIKCLSKNTMIELKRDEVDLSIMEEDVRFLIERIPFAIGSEHIDVKWICSLLDALQDVYQREVREYDGLVCRYFLEKNENINVVGRVYFHLVETKEGELPFAFMAAYSTKSSKSSQAMHTPLRFALKEFQGDDRSLLSLISSIVKVANQSTFISDLLESGELFSPIRLTASEAHLVLNEIPIYEAAGILCRIPNWWKSKKKSFSISLNIGESVPSTVGLQALMTFSPKIMMEDVELSKLDLEKLLAMTEGLALYKGNWVEVDHKRLQSLQQALLKLEAVGSVGLTMKEVLRFELDHSQFDEFLDVKEDVFISNGEWLRKFRSKQLIHQREDVQVTDTFKATLREYQNVGFKWLYELSKYGFGACLADDMGLGKTVQVIALLEYCRVHGSESALLVIPASLIGNWQHELNRFAPQMSYQILHKSETGNQKSLSLSSGVFLYVTTYTMVSKIPSLKDKVWDFLIIDEAQAIKNPMSKQSKMIKSILAKSRIAMTGTPIENRLSDLWSLYDFLNQGLLGTPKEFSTFTKGFSDNPMGYAKLRMMVQPFMMRRLKTDKSIITDLPEKLEVDEYTLLSKMQITLYTQVLKQIQEKLFKSEGIERKGLILSSIVKFKQICNHPDHYLHRDEFRQELSGKFERLKEICEVIYEKRERVLVFTQFKEMVEPLSDFLQEVFRSRGLVLHGQTAVNQRKELVSKFNGDAYVPYMVLSLKAGGVGLNLTSANHVIHFDRWWNPAVENQATDRVFRIGQMKNVVVYKFITQGTIEEKIDQLIVSKTKLSSDILGNTQEQWITELSNDELMNLFSLGGVA